MLLHISSRDKMFQLNCCFGLIGAGKKFLKPSGSRKHRSLQNQYKLTLMLKIKQRKHLLKFQLYLLIILLYNVV